MFGRLFVFYICILVVSSYKYEIFSTWMCLVYIIETTTVLRRLFLLRRAMWAYILTGQELDAVRGA